MRLYNMRILQTIGISIISITLIFTLNSCIRDEIVNLQPIVVGNDCDTTNISYSLVVVPLFTQCLPCHNNSNNYAGVNLEGYENTKKEVSRGDLIGSLRNSMSSYFSSSDCDFLKIQAWKNQGSKNN